MGTKRVGMARVKSLINENVNQLKFKTPEILAVSVSRLLLASESGATVYWTLGSAHHITLPDATVGLTYDFVIETGAAALHTIITQSSDKIHGSAFLMQAGTADQCNAQVVEDGAGVDKVHFKSDGTTTGGGAGNTCKLTCVETGKWVATVHATTSGAPGGTIAILAN